VSRLRTSILAAIVVALVAAAGALALPSKTVVFSGTFTGQSSVKIDGTTATIAATGAGKSTIGAGKIIGNGTGDSSQQPCVPFGGTGTITGTGGTITFKLASGASGCGDEGGHTFAITAHLTVLKVTGKLAKAKGTLKLTGVYNHDDGSFSVKVSGNLTKPK
jgi:hypothetical protein